jgi:hypothetical protein
MPPQVTIQVGSAVEMVPDERRDDLAELATNLGHHGYEVDLKVIEYVPGRRGVSWIETVAIFVAGGVSGAGLEAITADLYNHAKQWTRQRWQRKSQEVEAPRPQAFVIYGPNNEVLRRWKIDKTGEHDL